MLEEKERLSASMKTEDASAALESGSTHATERCDGVLPCASTRNCEPSRPTITSGPCAAAARKSSRLGSDPISVLPETRLEEITYLPFSVSMRFFA